MRERAFLQEGFGKVLEENAFVFQKLAGAFVRAFRRDRVSRRGATVQGGPLFARVHAASRRGCIARRAAWPHSPWMQTLQFH